jgi:predicted MFS family arabinose efflux permease
MFTEPREQAKAIGVFAFVASAGGSIGLLAGGLLTQALSWHWIFFVNVPIGIATAVLAVRLLERDRGAGLAAGADVPGALLITTSLMLGVYTIVKPAAEHGWGSPQALLLGALALALLAGFLVREATAATPLVPLRIFRSRNVAGANLIQALTVAGMFGLFFMGALYLQKVRGYDALQTGLAFLPTTLVMGTFSLRLSEPLIMRFGARRTLVPGLVVIAVGLVLFTRVPVNGVYVRDVLPTMILLGAGIGASFPALMKLAMSGATPADAGLASGLVNTTVQVAGSSTAAALTGGYHVAFWVGAALVLAALAVALTVIEPEGAQEPAPAVLDADAEPVPDYGTTIVNA